MNNPSPKFLKHPWTSLSLCNFEMCWSWLTISQRGGGKRKCYKVFGATKPNGFPSLGSQPESSIGNEAAKERDSKKTRPRTKKWGVLDKPSRKDYLVRWNDGLAFSIIEYISD